MAQEQLLSLEHLTMIATGFAVGTYARYSTIKEDYRQYPSHPNGFLINVVTGAVAAAIGAVTLPALITKNFVGVSFLALAIQQFRDVRKMERESLDNLDKTEPAPRGTAYIDGIAKTFESRNYLALITSFLCVLTMFLIPGSRKVVEIPAGLIVGLLSLYLLRRVTKGKSIGDIADIKQATMHFKGNMLYIDDIPVYNVGLPDVQERFLTEGVAVVITPRAVDGRIVLANPGQRQALVHEAARAMGVKRYIYQRRDFDSGRVCIALLPINRDTGALLELLAQVPVLESTKKSDRLRDADILPTQGE